MTGISIGVDFASVDGNKQLGPDGWKAQRENGLDFAIVRGSYEKWADSTAARDAPDIRAAGIVFGAYMFPMPGKGHPTAAEQVRTFTQANTLRSGDFPPVLDVEFPQGIAATGLGRAELLAWIREAVKALRQFYGIAPMIYTSKRVWDGTDTDSLALGSVAAVELADCALWLARYAMDYRKPALGDDIYERDRLAALPWPPTPAAWGEGNHWIHQDQGDAVGFKGFSSTVDVDRFRAMAVGETGPRVRWGQKHLRMVEGAPGVFDAVMTDAVLKFQNAFDLDMTGSVNASTFGHLAWR